MGITMNMVCSYVLRVIFLVVCIGFLSACSSAVSKQPAQAAIEQGNKSTLAEQMSDYEEVSINTTNGELVLSPTVVAPTQELVEAEQPPEFAYYDPLEKLNRAVFTFNHYSYKYALIPLAKGYNYALPAPIRQGVSNAFGNLREPLNLINNTLAGDGELAGRNLGRFLINSTLGLLGLFDPAKHWFDIPKAPKSFGDALKEHRVGKGAYIVLPILGQADVRSTVSVVTEGLLHPANFIASNPEATNIRVAEGFNDFTSQAELYIQLYEQANDPYLYFRNQYLQSENRDTLFRAASEE